MEATSKGHLEEARKLLMAGADPKATSNKGWTALKATPKGNTDIIALLKANRPR
jgi:hypothetical protein